MPGRHDARLAIQREEASREPRIEDVASFKMAADFLIESLRQKGGYFGLLIWKNDFDAAQSDEDARVIGSTKAKLMRHGFSIVDLDPYQETLLRLREKWRVENPEERQEAYCEPVRTVFYTRLFNSGLLRHAWLMDGWEEWDDSRWKREQLASRLGNNVESLSPSFHIRLA